MHSHNQRIDGMDQISQQLLSIFQYTAPMSTGLSIAKGVSCRLICTFILFFLRMNFTKGDGSVNHLYDVHTRSVYASNHSRRKAAAIGLLTRLSPNKKKAAAKSHYRSEAEEKKAAVMAHSNSLQENKKSADRASHRAHKVRAHYCANSEEREETSAA